MHARILRALRAPALLLASVASLSLVACSSGGSQANGAASGKGPDENPVTHDVSAADLAATKSTAPIAGDTAVLYVNGLGCPLCASNIGRQLERVKGVASVDVDLSVGRVDVGFKPGGARPSPAILGEAVEDAGFTLVKVETGGGSGGASGGAR